jgi:hypothetical protein
MQCIDIAAITAHGRAKFCRPELWPRLGRRTVGALFVPVPEAAVYEHGKLMAWEHDVGPSGKILPVQSEAVAKAVRNPPDSDFRNCVSRPDPAHNLTSASTIDNVHH